MRCQSSERGFTLIEVLIAVSVMAMVMAMAVSALQMAGRNVAAQTLDNMAFSAVETVVGEVADGLHYAQVSLPTTDGTTISFKVPVDHDGDGTVLDAATGNPEYGFYLGDMAVPRNGSIIYTFKPNLDVGGNIVQISEGTWGKLNGDTDSTDVFDVGYVEKRMVDSDTGQTITQKRGNWIIQPAGNYGGDIDGDPAGTPDPIFSMSGDSVTVSVWSLGVDPRVAPRLANSRATVFVMKGTKQ